MALELSIPTQYSVDATYFRADEIVIRRRSHASWVLEGYASKAHSDHGGTPVAKRQFQEKLSTIAAGPYAAKLSAVWAELGELIYLLSKTTPASGADSIEFADAGDV